MVSRITDGIIGNNHSLDVDIAVYFKTMNLFIAIGLAEGICGRLSTLTFKNFTPVKTITTMRWLVKIFYRLWNAEDWSCFTQMINRQKDSCS